MKPVQSKLGFAILYAVLLTTIILTVGLILMDIIAKQITLSTTDRNSQFTYYAALRGAQCAIYWNSKYRAFGRVITDDAVPAYDNETFFDEDPNTDNPRTPMVGMLDTGAENDSENDTIVCEGKPVSVSSQIITDSSNVPIGSQTQFGYDTLVNGRPAYTVVQVTVNRAGFDSEFQQCSLGDGCEHYYYIKANGYNGTRTQVLSGTAGRLIERTVHTRLR